MQQASSRASRSAMSPCVNPGTHPRSISSLFALPANTTSIIAIQSVDGVGAGRQGVLFPIMVADLTRGSGRYNIAQRPSKPLEGSPSGEPARHLL
jgi:hypothetical protein